MPENTGFLGGVVADWLQKVLSICYQNDLNMDLRNAAEESAAFFSILRVSINVKNYLVHD